MAKPGHPELRDSLLGPGSRVLAEASSRERVRDIDLTAADDRSTSTAYWQGLNLPGFALMEARHRRRARAHRPNACPATSPSATTPGFPAIKMRRRNTERPDPRSSTATPHTPVTAPNGG